MDRGTDSLWANSWADILIVVYIKQQTFTSPLKKGDEIITAATGSAIDDHLSLISGLKILESWGLRCRPQQISNRCWGYLAGEDLVRFNDIHSENHAPLIAFARGGWGSARLLERSQPWKKGWLVGFSDITSILLSRLSAGFAGGIHGPLVTSLANEPLWSQERLKSLLFGEEVPDLLGEPWKKGIATGPLVIANLTVASHLIGSSHMPDLKGSILILEDVSEAPYRIDRMLTHWRLAGILQELAGIGFGSFSGCNASIEEKKRETFNTEQVLKERSFDLGIPIVGNLPIGHCCGNASLPEGQLAQIDGGRGVLKLLPY